MKDCCAVQDELAEELDELAADPTLQVGNTAWYSFNCWVLALILTRSG